MTTLAIVLLAVLIFAASLLYASVGQAGASGYLAAMALLGVAPAAMKPTSLTLNIIVAAIATVKFRRAGWFSWPLFWPFAVTSVPCSFIGGVITLPGHLYRIAVGVILIYAAYKLFRVAGRTAEQPPVKQTPLWAALLSGTVIGLLSGLTGTGGGIFLSPLLLLMGWAEAQQSSGLSAAFILVNSAAALLGNLASIGVMPTYVFALIPAAVIGGYLGAEYGSRRFTGATLHKLLAAILVMAGLKIVFIG